MLTPQRKEFVVYLLAGVFTIVISVALFNLFLFLHMDYMLANLLSLLLTKLLAFIVNKVFVFKSKTTGLKALSKEFAGFFMGRIFTGLLDYFGLILLVESFSLPQKESKYLIMAIVVILNYILMKTVFTNTAISKRKGVR